MALTGRGRELEGNTVEARLKRLEQAILRTGLNLCEECKEYVNYVKIVYISNPLDKNGKIKEEKEYIRHVCIRCEHELMLRGKLK